MSDILTDPITEPTPEPTPEPPANSILQTILNMLGPYDDYEPYKQDIRIHINTFLSVLSQLGVGRKDFYISGDEETWEDFLGEGSGKSLEMVKDYLYLRVKMIFDPPTSTAMSNAMSETINELGWRLNTRIEDEEE